MILCCIDPGDIRKGRASFSRLHLLHRVFEYLTVPLPSSNASFPSPVLPSPLPSRSLCFRLRNPRMASRPHDPTPQDPQDQKLLDAALSGDDQAFTSALSAGADVNVVYEDGRNALVGVMTGRK